MNEGIVEKKYTAREDVVFTDLDDGSAVLLHLETKYYFSLNETGCFLWKKLDSSGGASEEDLIRELCKVYDIESGRAKRDVDEFIGNLSEQGLIK